MNNKKSKVFFYIGLSIVIFLILIVFFIGLYESLTGRKIPEHSILNNPEIISVVIGLIVSILFYERWKSLESRVEKLAGAPVDTLKSIQEFAEKEIDLKFKTMESKAQALSASVSGLVEKHPWLEVITEREMIVETDSCRGILRTCYTLLRDEKFLHLFEYLEYCSRKGTSKDQRGSGSVLRGTADDFYELSQFCEVWLGDHYLSAQFLKRFIEQYPESSNIFMPYYLRKLCRIGDLGSVQSYSQSLRKKVYGGNLYDKLLLRYGWIHPVSDRYKWLASNALILADTILCEDKWVKMYEDDTHAEKYAEKFIVTQSLYDAEVEIQAGNYTDAQKVLSGINEDTLRAEELRELSYLYSKLGEEEKAREIHERVMNLYDKGFGDDNYIVNKARSESERQNGDHLKGRRKGTSKDMADPAKTSPDQEKHSSAEEIKKARRVDKNHTKREL